MTDLRPSSTTGPDGEVLRLREGKAQKVSGTVEVVYADAWDELCETAQGLWLALDVLHTHALKHDPDYPGSAHEEKAHAAIRRYIGD